MLIIWKIHKYTTAHVLLCVFRLWIPFCDVRYDVCIKRCSVRLCFQLFVGGLMSYLRYFCSFVYSVVQHILCCVFALFFFVLCTLCCLFLWIILFWLPLWYSHTFIGTCTSIKKKNKVVGLNLFYLSLKTKNTDFCSFLLLCCEHCLNLLMVYVMILRQSMAQMFSCLFAKACFTTWIKICVKINLSLLS
jgi:hypothetical protein